MKKKKISFYYSLYESKKPTVNERGEEIFPLYIKITFDKKSTQFILPSLFGPFALQNEFTKSEFEEIFVKGNHSVIIESLIEKVIRYEKEKIGDNYVIKGIASRIDKYSGSLLGLISGNMIELLELNLGNYFTYNDFKDHKKAREEYFEETLDDMIFDDLLFFVYYSFYEYKRDPFAVPYFPLVNKLPEIYIRKIKALINFTLFKNYYLNEVESSVHLMIVDWLSDDKLKLHFRKFLESGSRKKYALPLMKRSLDFKNIFTQYENSVIEISPVESVSIINQIIRQSDTCMHIEHIFEEMKKRE